MQKKCLWPGCVMDSFYVCFLHRLGNWRNPFGNKTSNYNKAYCVDGKIDHPSVKPSDLIKKLLLVHSNEKDLVLDCFSGSGTIAVACSEMKRRFICIEKDKEYYEKSIERLNNYNKQLRLF